MSRKRKSLGTIWIAVTPDGDGMLGTMAFSLGDCWLNLREHAGFARDLLLRRGYRVAKVELREIP